MKETPIEAQCDGGTLKRSVQPVEINHGAPLVHLTRRKNYEGDTDRSTMRWGH